MDEYVKDSIVADIKTALAAGGKPFDELFEYCELAESREDLKRVLGKMSAQQLIFKRPLDGKYFLNGETQAAAMPGPVHERTVQDKAADEKKVDSLDAGLRQHDVVPQVAVEEGKTMTKREKLLRCLLNSAVNNEQIGRVTRLAQNDISTITSQLRAAGCIKTDQDKVHSITANGKQRLEKKDGKAGAKKGNGPDDEELVILAEACREAEQRFDNYIEKLIGTDPALRALEKMKNDAQNTLDEYRGDETPF